VSLDEVDRIVILKRHFSNSTRRPQLAHMSL
jgi:hypothetical protein